MGVTTRPLRLAAAVALVAAVAACDGDDDAGPDSTSVATTSVVTSTAPETTADSTTTTTVAPAPDTTVEETSTTVASTSVPESTTEPTPTTLPEGVPPRVTFPDDPDKQAVVDAVYAYFDALAMAQAAPGDELLRSALDDLTVDPIAERVALYLDSLVLDGEAFIETGDHRSTLEIFEQVVTVVDDSALVDACAIDRTVQVEVGGNPDGTDRLINDQVIAAVLTYNLTRVGDGWRVSELTVVDSWEDQEQCG